MAIYRPIQTTFWDDPYILDLSLEEKAFYLYLLTNDKTKQCGIYEIPLRKIEMETNLSGERILELFHKFQNQGKIQYSLETREIAVINWLKYNPVNNVNIAKCVEKELREVKNIELVNLLYDVTQPLIDHINKKGDHVLIENPFKTIYIPVEYEKQAPTKPLEAPYIPLASNKNNNKNNNKHNNKHKYGEFKNVLLTGKEYEKLKNEWSELGLKEMIQELDEGIELKGYKYKSHYLALRKWYTKKNNKIINNKSLLDSVQEY